MKKKQKQQQKQNWFESDSIKKWLPYICIVVIGFIIYSQTMNYKFIEFDDQLLIVDNYKFLKSFSNIIEAFKHDVFHIPNYHGSEAYYRPVFTISLMLDAQAANP